MNDANGFGDRLTIAIAIVCVSIDACILKLTKMVLITNVHVQKSHYVINLQLLEVASLMTDGATDALSPADDVVRFLPKTERMKIS